ncbi:hypothetical protein ACJIZ3_007448 [Penstemon smallii]|uniref:Sugar transporter SWEET1 n=1 Tax=Penstemon smallii TaxID=265156 RepID=A0ABD3SAJ7_9LAMI
MGHSTLVVGIIASMTSIGLIMSQVIDSEDSPLELRLIFIVVLNYIGLIFGFFYTLIFIAYTTKKHTVIIINVIGVAQIILFFAGFIMLEHLKGKSIIFGPIAVVFGIIMYGSPMSIIRNVYKTENVGYLSFGLCLASILNAVAWFIYAFLPTIDIYLAIANGIGILLGIVQLVLLCIFREKSQVYCIEKPRDAEIL